MQVTKKHTYMYTYICVGLLLTREKEQPLSGDPTSNMACTAHKCLLPPQHVNI